MIFVAKSFGDNLKEFLRVLLLTTDALSKSSLQTYNELVRRYCLLVQRPFIELIQYYLESLRDKASLQAVYPP